MDTQDEVTNINKLANINIIANHPEAEKNLVGVDGEGDNTLPLAENLEESKDLQDAKNHKKTLPKKI